MRLRHRSTHKIRYDVPTTTGAHNNAMHSASSELGDCVFVSTQDGWTALHLAAQEGKVDVARLLLTEAQALVNIQIKVH